MGNNFTKQTKTIRKYGWKKDIPDDRDLKHDFTLSANHDTIQVVDLRSKCPPIYNQGQLGSCTANAIAAAYEFDQMKENEEQVFTPSRLFIYYNERAMEGTVDQDSGAQIRDGIKSINSVGISPETLWPYDISKFTDKPTDECYTDAKKHLAVEYKRVEQNLEQMKQCLIEGLPFVFGITCYESLESDEVTKTGIVPMPKPGEKVIGGHALLCCFFSEEKRQFGFRNSWGSDWGCDGGYGYIPYDYLLNPDLASDFWTIVRVQDEEDSHVTEDSTEQSYAETDTTIETDETDDSTYEPNNDADSTEQSYADDSDSIDEDDDSYEDYLEDESYENESDDSDYESVTEEDDGF